MINKTDNKLAVEFDRLDILRLKVDALDETLGTFFKGVVEIDEQYKELKVGITKEIAELESKYNATFEKDYQLKNDADKKIMIQEKDRKEMIDSTLNCLRSSDLGDTEFLRIKAWLLGLT